MPLDSGEAAIRAILDAGASLGIATYDTGPRGVMRIENGYAGGNALHGTVACSRWQQLTTAADFGLTHTE